LFAILDRSKYEEVNGILKIHLKKIRK
jgi:hypothetical protein